MTTVPLATARDKLSGLVDDVARMHDTLTITRNGVPAAVLLSVEDYESIMETLALVNDAEDRSRLTEAQQSIGVGDVVDEEEMRRQMTRRSAAS